jgi:pyruvate formate lyase activating enzyme
VSAASSPSPADTRPPRLRVGGLTRFTSIDFPGRLSAVVFCQGCPWRCGYCHNPDLLDANGATQLSWDEVAAFLQARRGLLDGVVFSGGEPTLQAALGDAVDAARGWGFEVALHTGGMYPDRLAPLLPRLDWVGLDIKAPWDAMDAITGVPGSAARVRRSLSLLVESGVAFECRTTWHPGLFDAQRLHAMARELAGLGVRDWALQECSGKGPSARLPQEDRQVLARLFPGFVLRAA